MKIRKAVIPAAGLGTRVLPASKVIPKELLPIVDKPILQYMVEEAAQSGIEQVVLVTARGKEAMADHFDVTPELEAVLEAKSKTALLEEMREIHKLCEIITVRQHQPLGLGHAIGCARGAVGDEPFVALLPDDMIYCPEHPGCKQLIDVYDEYGKSVVGLIETPPHQISWYGIVEFERVTDKVVKISDCIEKPKPEQAPSNLGIVARYLFTPDIFDAIDHTPPGIGGEIQITDAIKRRAKEGKVMGRIFDGLRFDAGDKLGYLEAIIHHAFHHPELGEQFREMVEGMLAKEGGD
jgi:UTP--glucose-1-phosphate uridylyltransferase